MEGLLTPQIVGWVPPPEFLIQKFWDGTQAWASLTNSQVMLILLAPRPPLRTTALLYITFRVERKACDNVGIVVFPPIA